MAESIWIVGASQSGKTRRLIQQFAAWADPPTLSTVLVFAATGDNRLDLADRILEVTQGQRPFASVTPLGFFQDEVQLFLPLLTETLNQAIPFPVRLRPETEQELATRLWRSALETGKLQSSGFWMAGVSDYFLVRRTLDLLQLAASAGIPHEEIVPILQQGMADQIATPDLWEHMGAALAQWWSWCLERGLLTYGIYTELYWRYLLPHPTYQQHLVQRYHALLADDVEEYPAVMRSLLQVWIDRNLPAAFTYNPQGGIRLGLGADPEAMASLGDRCQTVDVLEPNPQSLGTQLGTTLTDWLHQPGFLPALPTGIHAIQTTSRGDLLRRTAEVIADAVDQGQIQPQEIAIIAPGLDAIARYTLREILSRRQISVRSLHDQQPLASSPLVRSLLTLLAIIYPGLGRLVDRTAIAELLVMLGGWQTVASDETDVSADSPAESRADSSQDSSKSFLIDSSLNVQSTPQFDVKSDSFSRSNPRISPFAPIIDPVRAGLLVDHCFIPDPTQPRLLPATQFARWDRLGFQTTQAYDSLRLWIETQQQQQQQRLIPSPVVLLDRAMQRFLLGGSHLPYDQLAALRELMETAQHYWEADGRLRQFSRSESPLVATVERFIRLLREGTITADPFPVRPIAPVNAVTLATVYQYRSDRQTHRWQFWLDAGSPFWLTGGGGLFGAPLLLQSWNGRPWTAVDTLVTDQQRLERQVMDLLNRATERVYLCYSELATSGQEQSGALLPLVVAATGDR